VIGWRADAIDQGAERLSRETRVVPALESRPGTPLLVRVHAAR
jgi:hypothetical protein